MGTPPREKVRLIVFIKLPIPGEVKTRLAQSLGAEKAAALYRAWVPPFLETLLQLGDQASLEVCVAPPITVARQLTCRERGLGSECEIIKEAQGWLPYPVDFTLQKGADLGERLTHAFERSFEAGWDRVLILGSDSPQLSSTEIFLCLDELNRSDMVLGPTEDGGYYAAGLAVPPEDLFRDIRWSTPKTLADTARAAQKKQVSLNEGPMSYDLDTLEDLTRLIRSDPGRWRALQTILG